MWLRDHTPREGSREVAGGISRVTETSEDRGFGQRGTMSEGGKQRVEYSRNDR